jgi:phosphonate transport system substrate-binding protein
MMFRFAAIALVGTLLLWASWASGEAKTYQFAVVPQYTPLQIHKNWHGLIEYLNKNLEFNIELKVYSSFEEFETAVLSGQVDFVYLNPYQYLQARKSQGYIPLVRDGAAKLQGILVVRNDSPYQSLSDLQGKELAFPSPNALAASLLMRTLLHERYKLEFNSYYVGSHSNVYRHIIHKKAAAGGGVHRTFNKQPKGLQDELRIIYQTPKLAPHPIIVHPRVAGSDRRQLQELLLSLSGSKYMRNIQMPQPIVANHRRDYLELESMGLEKYWVNY